MLNLWLMVLSFAVTTHNSTWDKSCFELKTSKRADDCCDIPGSFDEALLKRCYDEQKASKNEQEAIKCIAECVARELGAYKNHTLIRENSRLVFESTIGSDPNFRPVLGDVFEKCFNRITAIEAQETYKNATCHFAPAFMLNCVESGLFENCPVSIWNEGVGCDELKEKLEQGCPFFAISETL
ncbi:AAEL011482-PA [Aedes aegypti]|uniref:AAEL011482-PA n=1 Tax=Aedes aegypti TaxID=7159 RepID=Q16PX2_AEDAE|nr:AAEL011482-PA [Aedes aegypti]